MRLPLLLLLAFAACAPTASEAPRPATQPDSVRDSGGGFDEVAIGEGQVAEVDNTGKGAVLCAWEIYLVAAQVADACFAGQDTGVQAELKRTVARIDAFILANSSRGVTQAQLDARKQAVGAELARRGACTGDTPDLYRAIRAQGAAALRTAVDDLLSVPREPVISPCL